jgi:hypothetical protein
MEITMNSIYIKVVQPFGIVHMQKDFDLKYTIDFNKYIKNYITMCSKYAENIGIVIDKVYIQVDTERFNGKFIYNDLIRDLHNIDNLFTFKLDNDKGIAGDVELYELLKRRNFTIHNFKGNGLIKCFTHFYY